MRSTARQERVGTHGGCHFDDTYYVVDADYKLIPFGNEYLHKDDIVDQNDPTGQRICEEHLQAMIKCDEVHVYWDVDSKGSHFDLGMAYALEKDIIPICLVHPDPLGKSYWKAVIDV